MVKQKFQRCLKHVTICNFVAHISHLNEIPPSHQHKLHAEQNRLTRVFLYNDVELGQHDKEGGEGEEDGHDSTEAFYTRQVSVKTVKATMSTIRPGPTPPMQVTWSFF